MPCVLFGSSCFAPTHPRLNPVAPTQPRHLNLLPLTPSVSVQEHCASARHSCTPTISAARALLQLQKPARVRLAAFLAVLGSKTSRGETKFLVKKNWPTFGPVGRPDLPYAHFFYEKIFFRPALFLSRLERPKRPPNAPGLVSVAAAVLWQHYFHRRPPTAPPARRSREALVHWFGSVHTAHRPAVGCVLCQGVLPGPV